MKKKNVKLIWIYVSTRIYESKKLWDVIFEIHYIYNVFQAIILLISLSILILDYL